MQGSLPVQLTYLERKEIFVNLFRIFKRVLTIEADLSTPSHGRARLYQRETPISRIEKNLRKFLFRELESKEKTLQTLLFENQEMVKNRDSKKNPKYKE